MLVFVFTILIIISDDTKNNPKNLAKTFWDTDFESDAECEKIMPRIHLTDNLKEG